jgi:hypothetical protein
MRAGCVSSWVGRGPHKMRSSNSERAGTFGRRGSFVCACWMMLTFLALLVAFLVLARSRLGAMLTVAIITTRYVVLSTRELPRAVFKLARSSRRACSWLFVPVTAQVARPRGRFRERDAMTMASHQLRESHMRRLLCLRCGEPAKLAYSREYCRH